MLDRCGTNDQTRLRIEMALAMERVGDLGAAEPYIKANICLHHAIATDRSLSVRDHPTSLIKQSSNDGSLATHSRILTLRVSHR